MANTIVVPDTGKLRLAQICVNGGSHPPLTGNVQFHLYSALSGSLGAATVVGDFTEISYSGYSAPNLSGSNLVGIISPDQYKVTWATLNFQPTANTGLPKTALGYFVTENFSGDVIWCQAFSSPFTFTSTSSILTLIPELDFGQLA